MKLFNKNIVLIGMTGVGKTTLGKILSKETGREYLDIDKEIEQLSNLKIKDFFNTYGENEFRKLEKITLLKCLKGNNNLVISPGAGVLQDKELKKQLIKECVCIFLNAKIKTLAKRLKKNISNRPKLNEGKLEDNLKQMYIERIQDYKEAQITIDVDDIPIPDIISKIKESLSKL
ncbi:MAG: shikimate kinase [Pseudomonadota bacterium]|nr:shikimate kinase [Pseudomonadota bacterium]